jgi:hypothetical protein
MNRLEPIPIGLDHPASPLAQPPIRAPEAVNAPTAVCRVHNGRIVHQLADGDEYGKVYFCPIGEMYWRLQKNIAGMYAPLKFAKGL